MSGKDKQGYLCTAASCRSSSSWIIASTLNLKGCCPKLTETHSPKLHKQKIKLCSWDLRYQSGRVEPTSLSCIFPGTSKDVSTCCIAVVRGRAHLCKPIVGKRGMLTMFLNATPRYLPFFLQNPKVQSSAYSLKLQYGHSRSKATLYTTTANLHTGTARNCDPQSSTEKTEQAHLLPVLFCDTHS